MKTTFLFGVAALFAILVISCKQGESPQEEAALSEKTSADESMKNVLSSNAAVQNPDDKRKFIQKADIKFKVKNVAQSTYKIENAVNKFGGIVTNTDLQSHLTGKKQTKISADSTLQTIKYSVENNIILRIPNTKLDTVIKSIAKEIDYLDFRVIKADDVSLQLLAADLSQQRLSDHTKRLQNDIDQKGKKLNDIADAENDVLNKKQQSENAKIQNLAMRDQIAYSTITLAIYQNETIKQELVAIEKDNQAYGNFGLEILDGLKTGWSILASIIAFVVQLWSIILLALLGIFIYRKFLKSVKPV
ncbi:hypothetical protein FNO01nite_14340 [Flavobacterium noncentrifugens]|uniref:DUF4349 domain-containing protein n=1 Tax=Flavobacterium noncentrifugens TaxID=1128970 RepID=A0A1G8W625_9FLAO|nr:DUF4349 domain-containing protein [Flavobacterium noncentrifugens]GEP50762.1 hypothetical protein FNO01nite_14340 [Flavobacterium noncentrifugens]SDJ72970.1 protein of unknown function [Flavobacterium noncentrifugens]